MAGRLVRLLTGLWAGLLLTIAVVAAPAAFAALPAADAGRVVGRLFIREAWASLVCALVLLAMLRGRRVEVWLLAGTIICTLLGYFALQPLMSAARAGQGVLSFGQLPDQHRVLRAEDGAGAAAGFGAAAPAKLSRRPSS